MKQRNTRFILLALTLPILMTACATPNPGLYAENYMVKVGSNADFLIHPTGEYKQYADYQPSFHKTDDMDQAIAEMSEKGYVMIGYAAFNTSQSESYGKSTPQQQQSNPPPNNCAELYPAGSQRINCNLAHGIAGGLAAGLTNRTTSQNSAAMLLGNPLDAARWANAEVIYEQRGYAFSRKGYEERFYLANKVDDTTTRGGGARSGHEETYKSNQQGTSAVDATTDSTGKFNQDTKHVEGSVTGGTGGVNATVGGGVSNTSGTQSGQAIYKERGSSQMTRLDQSSGQAFQDYDDKVRHKSEQWATALLEKDVDHYDYLATFWKRVDTNKVAFGGFTEAVPKKLWKAVGTKQGRLVWAVIGGTPAHEADIWEGDILLAVNGEKIAGEQGWGKLLERYRGQKVKVTIWREGALYEVPIILNEVQAAAK